MRNFIEDGRNVTLSAPYDVTSGDGFLVGNLFAVAIADASSGDDVVGVTQGVVELPKDTSTFSQGDIVYWHDGTAKEVTTTSDGNKRIGTAYADAATGIATVQVRLDGVTT